MNLEQIGQLVEKIETSLGMKIFIYILGAFAIFCFLGLIWNYFTLGIDI